MPYLIDRQRALWSRAVVAIVQGRQRRIRSRVVLWDNGLYQTLTRPVTFLRCANACAGPVIQIGARAKRHHTAAPNNRRWRTPP